MTQCVCNHGKFSAGKVKHVLIFAVLGHETWTLKEAWRTKAKLQKSFNSKLCNRSWFIWTSDMHPSASPKHIVADKSCEWANFSSVWLIYWASMQWFDKKLQDQHPKIIRWAQSVWQEPGVISVLGNYEPPVSEARSAQKPSLLGSGLDSHLDWPGIISLLSLSEHSRIKLAGNLYNCPAYYFQNQFLLVVEQENGMNIHSRRSLPFWIHCKECWDLFGSNSLCSFKVCINKNVIHAVIQCIPFNEVWRCQATDDPFFATVFSLVCDPLFRAGFKSTQ